ncbi:MAG: hypothetical protein ACOYNI_07785 [Acidimicrobiia bacterium]
MELVAGVEGGDRGLRLTHPIIATLTKMSSACAKATRQHSATRAR